MAGADESPVIEDVVETVEKVLENNAESGVLAERTERMLRFPLTRIKTIMKTDNDVTLASLDAVVLIAKATEMFVHELTKEAYTYTMQSKKKTLQHRDLELAVDGVDALAFLEGTLDAT